MEQLQQVHFSIKTGDTVDFDENGNPSASYELVNWQLNENGDVSFVTIGNYDALLPEGKEFTMNGNNITWADNSSEVRL